MKRVLLLLLLCGGCRGPRSPESAVRALAEAAEAGDREAVFALLGPATQARLTVQARRAAQAAGRRELGPQDLLAVGWAPPRWHPLDFSVLEHSAKGATVEARGPAGLRQTVACVRVDGQWRVELP